MTWFHAHFCFSCNCYILYCFWNNFVFFFYSKKISSKKPPDFMNPLWEKILTGKKKIIRKNYSNCWLLIKDDEFCFWFFLASFRHEKHSERFRHCTCKLMRFLYYDIAKWGSGRTHEKNWKGIFYFKWFLTITIRNLL